MPPKRRNSGNSEDDGGGATNASPSTEPTRKRKRMDASQQFQVLIDFIRKYKREDGSVPCDCMARLPSKRHDPGYYEKIENPIDVMKIQQRVKTEEYSSLDDLKADLDLMISNCKQFYEKGSNEYKDANDLETVLEKAFVKVQNGEEPSSAPLPSKDDEENEITEFLEELLGCVMTATDPTEPDRHLNIVFQLLPSKRRYPEYYKVITEPIDLKTIATRIQSGHYQTIGEMEDELQLMFKNATSFNEPGSQIYKDAGQLSKLVKSKKQELDSSLVAKQNRGARSSRRQSRQVYSSQLVSLQYEDSESDDEDSQEEAIPKNDPLWQLYSTVRNYTTDRGVELAEAFVSLPSRRELPDYYKVISEPISLNLIKRKLKANDIGSLAELGEEMEKMFENCKTYNRPDSKLYKDAVKLQKIMSNKLEELIEEEGPVAAPAPVPNPLPLVEEVKKSPKDPKEQLKKRLKALYNSILTYTNSENTQPIGVFMEKPDKKLYPDYYDIISEPIDMNMIDSRIKGNVYKSEDEMIADCKLMFSNCRLYNEEGSAIYEDANTLEKVLINKVRELGVVKEPVTKKKKVGLSQKIKILYDTLKDYRDAKGRQLSLIFLKLPSKHEYPDYYDIIKRPIDMEKIAAKLRANTYDVLEDAVADFMLVFDNACKYNEPDSQIYKDAQMLQRLAHETVRHLCEEGEDGMPDVKTAVQSLLANIYHTFFTAMDNEDRCLADSLAELPEHDEVNGQKVRALSLEIIKRRVDRGLYKRLDLLQRDVFRVLERARKISRQDSQAFDDSIELQKTFIKARDEYTQNGTRLTSTAFSYTLDALDKDLTKMKQSRTSEPIAQEEDTNDGMSEATKDTQAWSGMSDATQTQFHVGEFIYVMPSETGMDPHIFHVERMYEKDGVKTLGARQFFRQRETFHVPTRTFYEKEVMQGEIHKAVTINEVLGKCYVMPLKDYFKYKPEGIDEKDIFVCEWRYTSKIRNWKKIKPTCFWDSPDHIKMVPRDKPLEAKKVPSVFKDRIEKHKEEVEELEALEKVVEEEIPKNVKWEEGPEDGLPYWEQFTIPGPITLRRGDTVFVRGENNRNMIAQIDTMWTGQDGMAYFNGPWFVLPVEIPPQPGRVFYRAEAFLSSISDSNPLLSVVGKCNVLDVKDYCKMRHTQYTESEVFICESLYDEGKRILRPLDQGGLKKYKHSPRVFSDEIYHFRNAITPDRDTNNTAQSATATVGPTTPSTTGGSNPSGGSAPNTAPGTPAPVMFLSQQQRASNAPSPMMDMNEDSLDAPPSIGSVSGDISAAPSPAPSSSKKKNDRKKLVTAYILFSADVRKNTMKENPGVNFGDISRMVADRWRQMPDAEKQVYSEKARRYNEEKEREEKLREEERRRQAEWAAKNAPPPPPQQQQIQATVGGPVMGGPPMNAGMQMMPQMSQMPPMGQMPPQSMGLVNNPQMAGPPQMVNAGGPHNAGPVMRMRQDSGQRPMDPLFHTVPPRTQRVLHSEAYIKYIEGLTKESRTMCNWEKQLNATSENTRVPEENRLPLSWLPSLGDYSTTSDAMWALRDFMLQESLGVVKIM